LPTVHLSLPEKIYTELKREAEEYGMQVTDIIKMFIREGLERRRKERNVPSVDDRIEILEIQVGQLRDMFEELYKRMEDLREAIEEIKSGYSIEPEIIKPEQKA